MSLTAQCAESDIEGDREMKQQVTLALSLTLAAGLLAGCAGTTGGSQPTGAAQTSPADAIPSAAQSAAFTDEMKIPHAVDLSPEDGADSVERLGDVLAAYDAWSAYRPETDGVLVAYSSIYGHTAEAANRLAEALREKGVETVAMDLARCDMAEAVAQAFRFSKLVLATPTYNADVFPFMKEFLHHLTERNYQNRTVAFIENGSWAPMAAKVMTKMLEGSKNLTYAATTVTVRGTLNAASEAQLAALADELSR